MFSKPSFGILTWFSNTRDRPIGPRTFGFRGALFGLPIQERKISPGLQAFTRGKYLAATSLRQHQALDFAGLAGVLVAINDYRAQPGIAGGGLEPYRHSVKKFTHYQFLLYS